MITNKQNIPKFLNNLMLSTVLLGLSGTLIPNMRLSTTYDKSALLFTTKRQTNFSVVPKSGFNGSTEVIGYADSECELYCQPHVVNISCRLRILNYEIETNNSLSETISSNNRFYQSGLLFTELLKLKLNLLELTLKLKLI